MFRIFSDQAVLPEGDRMVTEGLCIFTNINRSVDRISTHLAAEDRVITFFRQQVVDIEASRIRILGVCRDHRVNRIHQACKALNLIIGTQCQIGGINRTQLGENEQALETNVQFIRNL